MTWVELHTRPDLRLVTENTMSTMYNLTIYVMIYSNRYQEQPQNYVVFSTHEAPANRHSTLYID